MPVPPNVQAHAQSYVDAALAQLAPQGGWTVVGEIDASHARQPHLAAFVRLANGLCFGTTAGVSCLAVAITTDAGLRNFELCALSTVDSPRILWLLSNLASMTLGILSPFFYGTPNSAGGDAPKPILPYESLMLGGDETRFLFVPRLRVDVAPYGPRGVDVVEPLPISAAQWAELGPLSLEDRARWIGALGARSVDAWRAIAEG